MDVDRQLAFAWDGGAIQRRKVGGDVYYEIGFAPAMHPGALPMCLVSLTQLTKGGRCILAMLSRWN